jgi:hypothetical protein
MKRLGFVFLLLLVWPLSSTHAQTASASGVGTRGWPYRQLFDEIDIDDAIASLPEPIDADSRLVLSQILNRELAVQTPIDGMRLSRLLAGNLPANSRALSPQEIEERFVAERIGTLRPTIARMLRDETARSRVSVPDSTFQRLTADLGSDTEALARSGYPTPYIETRNRTVIRRFFERWQGVGTVTDALYDLTRSALFPTYVGLIVDSEPKGATIQLLKQPIGVTRTTRREIIAAHTYSISFTLPGYRSVTRSVWIDPAQAEVRVVERLLLKR